MKKITFKNQFLIASAIALASIFTSCEPKKNETVAPFIQLPDSGVYIINEGSGKGTGSVGFYDRSTKKVTNDLYSVANDKAKLNDFVQSINIINGKTYIVSNNVTKITVVNSTNFKYINEIDGFAMPRYMLPISNSKAYVSQWGATGNDGSVKVVDLSTNTISKSITTGKGAEKMFKKGNYVYVTCNGGFENDSVITIINTTTDVVEKTLTAGAKPSSIVEDANGNIWVLCSGKYNSDYTSLEKSASLVKINPTTNTIEQTINFNDLSSTASNLTINKDKNKLFFNFNGAIVSQNITSSTFDKTVVVNKDFYGLGIDPTTDIIYGADAGDYSSAGKVIRYNISGAVIDTLKVGIAPNGFFFK